MESTTDFGTMTQDEIALVACYAAANSAVLGGITEGDIVTGHANWNGQVVQVIGVDLGNGATPLAVLLNTKDIAGLQWTDEPFKVTPDIAMSALVDSPHAEAIAALTGRASSTPDTFADDYSDDDLKAFLQSFATGAYADDSGDEDDRDGDL